MTELTEIEKGFIIKHKSCEAHVYEDEKVCSIQMIYSKEPKQGHGTEVIEMIEQRAFSKGKEVWFPTPFPRIWSMLEKRGYIYTNVGPHEMEPEGPDVFAFIKKKVKP